MRRAVAEGLLIHPRIIHQHNLRPEALRTLSQALPELPPFRNRRIEGVRAVLDWDHRLPSKSLTLRLHMCYTATSLRAVDSTLDERRAEIRARDLYPEFDVPDYLGLPADEVYDVELRLDLSVSDCRLVSAWRREIAPEDAVPAVAAVRRSAAFQQARAAALRAGRSAHLGDLEAVAWTPPCESGHGRWTLDVWWLTAFDGRLGKGWSFLVDPEQRPDDRVVAQREFSIRTG